MSLDTGFSQVLIDFFDDRDGLYWHHRLLLVGDGSGRWIAATPDEEILLVDLTDHRVVPLPRAAPIPEHFAHQCYIFDDTSPEQIAELHRRARDLAAVLGFKGVEAFEEGGTWRVSDTAHPLFGAEVPGDIIAQAETFVARGRVALVQLDVAGESMWSVAEYVGASKEDEWRIKKATGPGRDPRVLGLHRDARGVPFLSETDAMALFKSPKVAAQGPFRGTPVAMEFFESLRSSGETLLAHHYSWEKKSGVAPLGAVSRVHLLLSECLRLLVTVDQIDPTVCSGCEMIVRGIVREEAAVRRNPKIPDYTGLDLIMENATDSSGAAVTAVFSEWLSRQQMAVAQIAKQGRLLREEEAAARKQAKGDGKGKKGDAPPPQA